MPAPEPALTTACPGGAGRARARRWDRWARLVIAGLAVLVFAVALGWHPRLGAGGETDQYLQIAEDLQRGKVRQDHFHPLLYPLVLAVVGLFTPTVFWAGKLVSAVAFGCLLTAIHRLLRRAVAAPLALGATVAVALGPVLWLQGMRVATDMFGAALVVSAYAIVLDLGPDLGPGGQRRATYGRLFLVGVCAGAAVTTRYNLALHAPILLLGSLWRTGSLRASGPWLCGAGLAVLPHGVTRWLASGSVFDNDNWRNVVLKYGFDRDRVAMAAFDAAELREMLRTDWGGWLVAGLQDLMSWLCADLPRLLLEGVWAGTPFGGIVIALLLLLGGLGALGCPRSRPIAVMLLAAALLHAAVVTITFYAVPRLTLIATVLIAIVAVIGLHELGRRFGRRLGATFAGAAVLAIAAEHALGIPPSWARFRAQHAEAEIAAARALVARHGQLARVAGTYPFLDRELECAGTTMLFGLGGRGSAPTTADLWQRLEAVHAAARVSWFVIGRATNPRMHGLARDAELPRRWGRPRADADVVVLHRAPALALALDVVPRAWRAGPLTLRLVAPAVRARAADYAWIGVELRGPAGMAHRLPFTVTGEGFELALQHGVLAAGRWRAIPAVLERPAPVGDGGVVHGAVVESAVVEGAVIQGGAIEFVVE